MILAPILLRYKMEMTDCSIEAFGNGLINHTWKIRYKEHHYILQRINDKIFKHPEYIDENINAIGKYLNEHHPDYLFVLPISDAKHQTLIITENNEYFRMLPFIADSVSFDVVKSPILAYRAAQQFGKFTRLLSAFPKNTLKTTITNFHNLTLRYQQFEEAIHHGNPTRIHAAQSLIDELMEYAFIAEKFIQIENDSSFKKRITHHDTKISNILFNQEEKALCVIDLDTVMPGYFISDLGDMIRTYVCPVNEEEIDFSKILIRDDYFKSIVEGYLHEMKFELTSNELNHFVYAGQFMIYMQAIRFLTDYLNNDQYYGAKYEEHNLNRAMNQTVLLRLLNEKEQTLNALVADCIQ